MGITEFSLALAAENRAVKVLRSPCPSLPEETPVPCNSTSFPMVVKKAAGGGCASSESSHPSHQIAIYGVTTRTDCGSRSTPMTHRIVHAIDTDDTSNCPRMVAGSVRGRRLPEIDLPRKRSSLVD